MSSEIVYMAPVKLNKDTLVNKAGVEVDVIPIMRSPCVSPRPRKKKKSPNSDKRAKSEMGFYSDRSTRNDDHGSLPDLKATTTKISLYNTILQMKPERFLSTESLLSGETRTTRSLGSEHSLTKGVVMNAVVSWLQKSSPFSSTDNFDHHSSVADTVDTSIFDEDDLLEHSEISKSEHRIPDILVLSEDEKINESHEDLETAELLTEAVPLTTTIPLPKPRTVKSPTEDLKRPKSPVRDDLLDDVEEETPLPETYSDKKKFWEEVAQEKPDTKVASKKRVSISESPTPPVPKPRTALQSSQSVVELETEVSKVSVKERALSFESSTSEGSLQTDLTRLSESIVPLQEEKIMTEYQASFQPPTERKEVPRKLGDTPRMDSLDSDIAQKGNGQLTENTGYISDSEDVEHYISDSEIEDRVPQIRDRMMSVFMPSATAARKSVYERSASLPTEDLYEVSARNIKSRKEYYEEQIRKEMIEEQFTSEIEEEPSPEKKNLLSSTEEEHTEADAKSLAEDVEEISEMKESASVKSLARAFEEKVLGHMKKDTQMESQEEEKQRSVKGLAKEYEKQLGNVIAGQRIGQTSSETAKFVLDTQKVQEEKLRRLSTESHSTVEKTQASSIDSHKELEIDVGYKMVESQQSISSDKSADMPDEQNYKDDSHSTKPDSMEVLVDKSEIEDTEKIAELDQELEGRSIASLDAEDARPHEDDNIPEITITLSGKQKRMSEEDSETSDQDTQHVPVHVPQEQVHATVWEVSVELEATPEVYEKVEEIAPSLKQADEIVAAKRDTAATERESTSQKTETIWEAEKYEVEEVKESSATKESEKYELEDVKEKEVICYSELPKTKSAIEESRTGTRTEEYNVLMKQQEQMSEKLEARLKEQKDETSRTQSESMRQDKEDDLSSSLRDESDMGSELHQDHSDSYESEKMKSESHSEIERIILDSLHQQKVHPEEAKKIAHSLLMEIEAEIQNREMNPEAEKPVTAEKVQVSEFLKHLAEIKGLDEREVELVESVLARRQRGIAKLARGDTQASSIEITDEDLRYSGTEMDYSHILEQQMDQLEAEKIKDDLIHHESTDKSRKYQERTGYADKIDEHSTQESTSSQDYESYEPDGIRAFKKDLTIKSTDSIKCEKSASETKNVVIQDEKVKAETLAQQKEVLDTHIDTTVKESTYEKSQEKESSEVKLAMIDLDMMHISGGIQEKVEIIDEDRALTKSSSHLHGADSSIISAKYATDLRSSETLKDGTKEIIAKTGKEYGEISIEEKDHKHEQISITIPDKDGTPVETTQVFDKTHLAASSTVTTTDHRHEVVTSVTSTVLEGTGDLKEFTSGTKTEQVVKHEVVKRSTSNESKSSRTSDDADSSSKKDIKLPDVVMRKHASDTDSSSAALKPDRKSTIEFEAYSSSGESHYQSFEIDSGKSRPCSSDVEGLVAAAGSSEYESALTSQDHSAKSHMTHTDYHTAISSISSKDSMKSLDSESSGNLASVEVSEHSETLVPSSSDLEDILDPNDQQLLDEVEQSSAWSGQGMPVQRSLDASDSDIASYTGIGESVDISEDEPSDTKASEVATKMKRSCEMTFQPEPKEFVPDSPQGEGEEKLGTSLDEGSILSMSVSSTTSSTGAQRTVIELSRADSERHEGSMTVSGTSEHLSMEDVEMMIGSRESLITPPVLHTIDISTSTAQLSADAPITSVTITTSAIDENGTQSVSTQVTSEARVVPQRVDEPRKRGHRRNESTFTSAMISSSTRTEIERKYHSDLAESDKYTSNLSFKESSSDEKKDVDETEKEESYETEADQGFHRDIREGRYTENESDVDLDISRPQSRFSKSDSERPTSDERIESELADLAKSSDVTEITDPIERPTTPEPSNTPEARASVSDLEQELSSEVIKPREGRRSFSGIAEVYPHHLEKRDSHGKSSSTSSEKSSFEEAEAEAVFGMVAHVSPAHKIKQIVPIPEDADAEDHEIQAKERAQKEFEERQRALKDVSPGFVPDIMITQHMQPLIDESFTYPDLELEAKEKRLEQESAISVDTSQTPSSKSSEETDQGREYVLDESVTTILEEPEGVSDDKILTESKSEIGTAIEATLKEGSERGTESPESDSFEMLEKPDIIDDFVVIEEVGKEAQEQDTEGKSMKIGLIPKKPQKHDEEVEKYLAHSAPTPLESKMTDVKYYPEGSSSEELGFDFEESPPLHIQNSAGKPPSSVEYGNQYDRELEANRKWIEQQFQGDQAALIAAGYGYEMDFERGPLEDIKEEDINDLAASSYGSHRESGGSLKESYSSTPEYDVLAGRKYFTRSAEHDDVSMSSLQEFENLEKAMSLEMRKFHHGSQDSSSNGSFKTRYSASKGGQGDDISVSSLKEFEGLEKACIAAHKIEIKVKEEEAMLAQIDEGPESIVSESESSQATSDKKVTTDTEEDDDYEKRMFEIDEIIRQAQTNVERFVDLKEMEKTESLGRGDSVEEVSKVPDLDLDAPLVKSTIKVQWKESDDVMITSTDSLDLKEKPSHHDSTDSLDQKTGIDIMTASTDSIEFQVQKSKDNIMSDSIEIKGDEKSYMVSSDSLELAAATSSGNILLTDSIDEDCGKIVHDYSSSSTGKDFSSSTKDEVDQDIKTDYMIESTESVDVTSSTATHATYQYDTDSIFSGSFTSGGSNTMVSSTTSLDQSRQAGAAVDVAAAVRRVWFDEEVEGHRTTDYVDECSKPYVTEVIEPSNDERFSHTIHRKVELPPEVRRVTFTGADADERLKQFMKDFNEGEECFESEETDEFGNVHVRKVVRRKFIVKSGEGEDKAMSGPEIEEYFRQLNQQKAMQDQGVISKTEGRGVITKTITDGQGTTTITQQFDLPPTQLTTLTKTGSLM
nr:unnamed protein product [Callosobruchus analis]